MRSTRAERHAAGKALRKQVPRERHGEWKAPRVRADPVDLIIESSKGRLADLVPIRYGRMAVSPFTFYRGAALNMAADLAHTPATGIRTQVCGDCHLLNFGGFATPERRIVFDINDFDETLPGPWEWDVKRLAASFVHAARSNGYSERKQHEAALACVRSYRERMAEYAGQRALDVWYASIDEDSFLGSFSDRKAIARERKQIARQNTRVATEYHYPKMTAVKGRHVLQDNPPLISHDGSLTVGTVREAFESYRRSLPDVRRFLLDRHHPEDVAFRVVGVGSVGTYCAVMLMMSDDGDDPWFLQVKEARASVLARFVGKSAYPSHGQRVVTGQRLMQSASDIFLGWAHGAGGKHFYLRQLRDMKLKPPVEDFDPTTLIEYATVCGWTVARAHARSGDAAMISGYLGKSDVFDRAIARFSRLYADQVERDYAAFLAAIRNGRIEARAH